MIKRISLALLIVSMLFASGFVKMNFLKLITIWGSTTIRGLVKDMARKFTSKTGISIDVKGGGSGRGVYGIYKNLIHIGNSSRDIRGREIFIFRREKIKIKRIKIGILPILIIVNKKNNWIKSLDVNKIRDIYLGRITNWKQLGGPDERIIFYTLDRSSGVGHAFLKIYLGKKYWRKRIYAINTGNNNDMCIKVSENRYAIGYTNYLHYNKYKNIIKTVSISNKEKGIDFPVMPTLKNIKSNKYHAINYMYQFVREKVYRKNLSVKKFIHFMLNNPKITRRAGFIPVDPKTAISDVW